jgi:hypothetical protein
MWEERERIIKDYNPKTGRRDETRSRGRGGRKGASASQGDRGEGVLALLSSEGSSIVQWFTVRLCSLIGGVSINLLPATTASSPYLTEQKIRSDTARERERGRGEGPEIVTDILDSRLLENTLERGRAEERSREG